MSKKKLSDFECGYICALANLINSHGAGTEAIELYMAIGCPTPAQLKQADLSDYDISAIKELRKSFKGKF